MTAIQAKVASPEPQREAERSTQEAQRSVKPTIRRSVPPRQGPARSSPAPAASPQTSSKLATLAAILQRSTAHPLSQDPAFQAFVDEATARARGLSDRQRRSVMAQLDLFIDTADLARLRPILDALDPPPHVDPPTTPHGESAQ